MPFLKWDKAPVKVYFAGEQQAFVTENALCIFYDAFSFSAPARVMGGSFSAFFKNLIEFLEVTPQRVGGPIETAVIWSFSF